MVAIRFKTPEERASGFMLLARQGRVRTLRGEVYVCNESHLVALDDRKIHYERIPLPVNSNEVDALRNTPTTVL